MKVFAENRKAKNSYEFLDFYVAGVVLSGPETKSVRNGGVSIVDAFASIDKEEAYILEMNIESWINMSLFEGKRNPTAQSNNDINSRKSFVCFITKFGSQLNRPKFHA